MGVCVCVILLSFYFNNMIDTIGQLRPRSTVPPTTPGLVQRTAYPRSWGQDYYDHGSSKTS